MVVGSGPGLLTCGWGTWPGLAVSRPRERGPVTLSLLWAPSAAAERRAGDGLDLQPLREGPGDWPGEGSWEGWG